MHFLFRPFAPEHKATINTMFKIASIKPKPVPKAIAACSRKRTQVFQRLFSSGKDFKSFGKVHTAIQGIASFRKILQDVEEQGIVVGRVVNENADKTFEEYCSTDSPTFLELVSSFQELPDQKNATVTDENEKKNEHLYRETQESQLSAGRHCFGL